MTFFRTTEPAVEPVTLADMRGWLRVDHLSEDTLIEGLIRAAREDVEASTGRALITQDWRLCLDRWPKNGRVVLSRFPVAAIVSVTAFDASGDSIAIDPASFVLAGRAEPSTLSLAPGVSLPDHRNGIEIDLRAGYGDAGADVPDGLRHMIRILVAHWYEFRGAFSPADHPVSHPEGYERLVRRHRVARL